MIVFAILVGMVVVAPHAEGISCQTVVNSLLPCKTYLKQGGTLPANCCSGARSLNSAANTPSARKTACQCMKIAAKAYGVKPQYAAAVPRKCNVNIGYAISYNTNCNNI
ncbi:hypothetical protein Pfo_030002 [Paulownia fortunei]|nr:hypothetical protein Pfo_030002 [Paulownia fortunei]